MKKIVILGAGTAGTMIVNKLRKALDQSQWDITIVDEYKTHYYQPGFLFIPFGKYTKEDVKKPKIDFLPKDINVIFDGINRIDSENNQVMLTNNQVLKYDLLIIASGTKTRPDQTPGLLDKLWYKKIFDFYTVEGALALHEFFKNWEGGHLVMSIAEIPIKCPVAPIEFVLLADEYFTKRGIRDKVKISYVTPLSGCFTKPIASHMLSKLLEQKNIHVIPDYYLESVDNDKCEINSYDNIRVNFDVLVIVPVNMGDEMIARSDLGDDLNYVPTDKETLQSIKHKNIFVLGDASNIPTSKAGSVAHFSSEILFENILNYINEKPLSAKFDGHSNCYIESGFNKASLIDFNYDTEPLPGTYPISGIGPFSLLKPTLINHYGKLFFRWIYWNMLIKGKKLPVGDKMSMKGKKQNYKLN